MLQGLSGGAATASALGSAPGQCLGGERKEGGKEGLRGFLREWGWRVCGGVTPLS